jgi:iterative type I PKS product template protein
MALTIADYLHKKRSADVAPDGMDVCSMEVDKPLILNTDLSKPQLIQIAAHLRDHTVNFRFYGVNADGAKTVDHAVCRVKYANAQKWLNKWNRSSYLIHNQIQRLENAIGEVSTHRLGRGMAYKLFTALVDYDESYRGMDEVILDATAFDASAKVTFKSDESDYYMDPRWIDNLCHITGFIVNASEATQSDEQVYISHGWESLRFGTRFSYGKSYRTYARMQLAGTGSVRQGDVYILDGETIVGLAGGVKFQCVPRKLLDHLLPPVGKSSEANNNTTAVRPSRKEPSHAASATKASSSITPTSSISPPASSVTKALEIIATECGVEPGDLGDNSAFEEFGIDSLLSLTILARIREELDVPLESGFFMDNPTVADLKRFFGSFSLQHNSRDDSVSGSAKSSTGSSVSGTPAECESDTTVNGNEDVPTILRTIIANEVGVEVNEITDNADLTAMGLDSLMSLSITAGIREQTDLTVPDDLLSRCTTVMDIEKALGITHAPLMSRTPATPPSPPPSPVSRPHALSFLIQGNPRTARETVFFFPDGSGSATSYAPIPPIGKDVCAYSLNCPFMKTPEDFRCGIDGVSSIYVEEVKRRQPKGPYNLGGWSAGGVMAYEAAWQLQAQGETVSRLILIDAPCPVKLEPVPSKLFGFFDSIGVLGDRNQKASPPYLIPHFEAMIRNLDTYIAKPFPRGKEPQVLAIWAQDGVCKNPEDPKPNRSPDDPKVMDWLLNNRVDFGANGWDQLLAERFKCVSMEGNHFSMIVEPLVSLTTQSLGF